MQTSVRRYGPQRGTGRLRRHLTSEHTGPVFVGTTAAEDVDFQFFELENAQNVGHRDVHVVEIRGGVVVDYQTVENPRSGISSALRSADLMAATLACTVGRTKLQKNLADITRPA